MSLCLLTNRNKYFACIAIGTSISEELAILELFSKTKTKSRIPQFYFGLINLIC